MSESLFYSRHSRANRTLLALDLATTVGLASSSCTEHVATPPVHETHATQADHTSTPQQDINPCLVEGMRFVPAQRKMTIGSTTLRGACVDKKSQELEEVLASRKGMGTSQPVEFTTYCTARGESNAVGPDLFVEVVMKQRAGQVSNSPICKDRDVKLNELPQVFEAAMSLHL